MELPIKYQQPASEARVNIFTGSSNPQCSAYVMRLWKWPRPVDDTDKAHISEAFLVLEGFNELSRVPALLERR